MNSISCLRLLIAGFISLGLQSCEFYHGVNFVRNGLSQSDLRSLFERHSSLVLTEDEEVLNAYSNSGRDPTFWFEVSFGPQQGENLRKMLLRKGYVVRTEQLITSRVAPKEITGWWNSVAIEKATLFALDRDKMHPDANGVWCFFDEEHGKLFVRSVTY